MDRVHEFKDVRGAVAIADTGEGEAQPRRGVRVLSSIFADPRRIGLDISGVAGRVMEGRPEKPDQPVVIAYQFARGRLDRRSAPPSHRAGVFLRPGRPPNRAKLFIVGTANHASHTLSPWPRLPTRFIP